MMAGKAPKSQLFRLGAFENEMWQMLANQYFIHFQKIGGKSIQSYQIQPNLPELLKPIHLQTITFIHKGGKKKRKKNLFFLTHPPKFCFLKHRQKCVSFCSILWTLVKTDCYFPYMYIL